MSTVARLSAVYLVGVAVVVALYFIINPLHAESYNPENVWFVLDILMVIGAVIALGFNTWRKMRERGRSDGDPITRRYVEVNLLFYATVAVTVLLVHSWFSILVSGLALDDHQAWVKWAMVDTLLPLIYGATGFAIWREGM